MSEMTFDEREALRGRLVKYQEHIWYDPKESKWYYEDETEDITNGPYDTKAEAHKALWDYIDTFLKPKTEAQADGPARSAVPRSPTQRTKGH